jgi:hypothetical protein
MKSLSIILICSAAVACSTVQPQVPQLEAPMPATPAQEQKQQDEEKRAPKTFRFLQESGKPWTILYRSGGSNEGATALLPSKQASILPL